jgi:hypothetical protein
MAEKLTLVAFVGGIDGEMLTEGTTVGGLELYPPAAGC